MFLSLKVYESKEDYVNVALNVSQFNLNNFVYDVSVNMIKVRHKI